MCASIPPSGHDLALAGDDFGCGANHDGDPRLDIGVASFSDSGDPSIFDSDVCLDDAPVVDNECVGEYEVDDFGAGSLALAHAVSNHLPTAERHLIPVDCEVLLHLDPEFGVGESNSVARRGSVKLCVCRARESCHCAPSSETHHVGPEAVDFSVTRIGDQFDGPSLSGFEANCGASGNIEPKTSGLVAVEYEGRIGLEEVIVRAHLNWTVSVTLNGQSHGRPSLVEDDVTFRRPYFAWLHWFLSFLLFDHKITGSDRER